ncbi:MAG: hypothetical protein GY797_38995 [Deltaproteobacteria bacterium]|nr:hypothetical protein [Deltaproteobacteria bacterium]
MKKIVTNASRRKALEKKAKTTMICTGTKGKGHCVTHCFHGIPHEKERERDACHLNSEICDILKPKLVRVTCKPLNKKQREAWIEKEIKK